MDIEQQLIAAILTNSSILNGLEISEEDFSNSICREIYRAMIQVSTNLPVDIVTVHSYLKDSTGKDYMPVLAPILKNTTYSNKQSAIGYAELIKKNTRRIKKLDILQKALQEDTCTDEIISHLMSLNGEGKKYSHTLKESMKLAYEEIEAAHNGVVGVDTGYREINRLLGGWRNSDLIIIGARPAMGKTALMINFARLAKEKSLIISGEQPAAQVAMRLISQKGSVHATRLRNAKMDEREWGVTSEIICKSDNNIFIYDKPNPSITDVIQQARKHYHEDGVKLLFLDYVQKIRPSRTFNNKAEGVAEVVEGLKVLARELNIPVVALAQVNREVEKMADKRPSMSHLKDSGTIEQEADAVAMLYRDSVYNQDSPSELAELNFEKNRHGPIGMINLIWQQDFMRFENEGY